MARPKRDPLLAALIAKLPPETEDWPVDRQLAWLRMMAIGFGAVYGGDAAKLFDGPNVPEAAPSTAVLGKPAKAKATLPDYYIDPDGYAMANTGARIMPANIGREDVMVDMRGPDGDMREIIWADDSKGVTGLSLPIMAA